MELQYMKACHYCGEVTLLSYGCCEECNWTLYIKELSETEALYEFEKQETENSRGFFYD